MTMPKGYPKPPDKCNWCGKKTLCAQFRTGKFICIDCFSLMGITG